MTRSVAKSSRVAEECNDSVFTHSFIPVSAIQKKTGNIAIHVHHCVDENMLPEPRIFHWVEPECKERLKNFGGPVQKEDPTRILVNSTRHTLSSERSPGTNKCASLAILTVTFHLKNNDGVGR
ncbi:hypothetical protein TNCV_2655521 [Trichonephila clavipes]|nr:hypothetical protein TNCV_2655521 [Trichonephila clavipes]